MKKQIIVAILILSAGLMSGCAIFNGGCKCPKVSYRSHPGK